MPALKTAIGIGWGLFAVYWIIGAARAKEGARSTRARIPSLVVIAVVLLMRVVKPSGTTVHNHGLEIAGAILFVLGVGVAVWARIYIGRNWGMPMTQKNEPELVTSGPYQYVRHPIYSGILLGLVGTALAISLYLLIAVGALAAYFIYSARVEEQLLTSTFPTTYPPYRMRTKMIVPFVL
jgi:protein-S-isoprenylcysteine O-methyltransferase Ste14